LKETHLLLLVVDMATNLWGFPSCDVGGFPPTDYWLYQEKEVRGRTVCHITIVSGSARETALSHIIRRFRSQKLPLTSALPKKNKRKKNRRSTRKWVRNAGLMILTLFRWIFKRRDSTQ